MCFVCIRVRLSFFVSFFVDDRVVVSVLVSVWFIWNIHAFHYGRIIIFVLPDRLTFALITIILFLFSDWMSPFDRVVCGEYPYHCYIGAAVSLKNIGQKFFPHSENRYWRRDYFRILFTYFVRYVRFRAVSKTKIRVNSKKVRTKFRIRIGANLFPSVRRCHIWQPYFRT